MMISLQQVLVRCTDEQLESLLQSSHEIMEHFEFVTGRTSIQLAGECEQYWKVYGIQALAFSELAARAQGKSQRESKPIS